ncbi:MAG: hypothetical protein AB1Z98_40020 [Nannocystaceae bacterium]
MTNPLVVEDEDPLRLLGIIDSASAFQLTHTNGDLDDHRQELHAYHEDLKFSRETIEIRLENFTHAGDSWRITASHGESTTISWSRATGYAHYSFGAMTDVLEVNVVATSDASPPQTKTRKIWIKTMPKDGQPDRP